MREQPETGGQKHVLVVDDNLELAQTYGELLRAFDYRATTAANGVQALKFILEAEVDAVICDLSMPQLEGDKFFNAAKRVRPELGRRFIFVTGNVDNPKYSEFLNTVEAPVLYKPVSMDNLLKALGGVFAEPSGDK